MTQRPTLKSVLKRGAFVTAANWQVVVMQFVAESVFKLLLAVPIIGGAFLVVLVVGGDLGDLLSGELRDTLTAVAGVLNQHPAVLVTFLFAFGLVLAGGSAFMFLVKGGTVSILVVGEREAGAVERFPVTLATVRRASAFSLEALENGCARLVRRYLVLGFILMAVYGISGSMYLLVVFGGYRLIGGNALFLGWTIVAALSSSALVVWITIVNLLYLLTQLAIAVEDVGVGVAMRRVGRFLKVDLREVAGVFGVVLALIVLATAASLLATAGLGLIAFVPLVWLIALPLQAAAWLLRGLVFQYLGLTALVAYLALYRSFAASEVAKPAAPTRLREARPPPVGQTA